VGDRERIRNLVLGDEPWREEEGEDLGGECPKKELLRNKRRAYLKSAGEECTAGSPARLRGGGEKRERWSEGSQEH